MNAEAIFAEALAKNTPTERAAYLDEACGQDTQLRNRVETLLRSHEAAGSFLGKPAIQLAAEELAGKAVGDTTEAEHIAQEIDQPTLGFLSPSDRPDSLGRLGHYEVLEVIGRGGMGIVLRAFDEKLLRVVAIKVMAPELATTSPPRKRFLREARSAAAVRHEHVVDIHAVEEQPIPYLVMEYVCGETLQQKHERVGPLEVPEVLRLGQQIARGLAAAHERGLIHRDIKPSNILLEKGVEERVKITDFGLARAVADASLTQSGVIAGTPMYMAPEQTVGDSIDHRADLFSLGSVLYTMCSGRPPFRATTSMATLKRVAEDTPRPIREIIPEVPEWLCHIIAKLHAKRPEDRFQSAMEVADLLGRCLTNLEQGKPVIVDQAACLVEQPHAAKSLKAAAPIPAKGQIGGLPTRRPHWGIAAAVLVLLLGGLSLGEATGVTNIRATIIRIFTPEGTLVVETDDPAVKVTVEGDGDLVITGAGPQEVRLKPGSYNVRATKDGKPVQVDRDLVTITHGDKQVVRVRLEAGTAAAAAPRAQPGAFVLLAVGMERKFDTLSEAVLAASDGDTIEVRGNGPFLSQTIQITGSKTVTIRAGVNFRPVIKFLPKDGEPDLHLFTSLAPLVLEGLEFHESGQKVPRPYEFSAIFSWEAPLFVANCRFLSKNRVAINQHRGPTCQIRNCEFLCGIAARSLNFVSPAAPGTITLDNNVIVENGSTTLSWLPPAEYFSIRLTRNSQWSWSGLTFALTKHFDFSGADGKDVKQGGLVQRSGNVLVADACLVSFFLWEPHRVRAGDALPLFRRLLKWEESSNVVQLHKGGVGIAVSGPQEGGQIIEVSKLDSLAEWTNFWELADLPLMQGSIRFQGGDLLSRVAVAPDKITPEDFRLRPDSAGYRAGKDGKDLGADVDLVGPGAAYERWKKTPAYQEWLKESGQKK
jgi:hypothetical protein